jgi:hypothetical protein
MTNSKLTENVSSRRRLESNQWHQGIWAVGHSIVIASYCGIEETASFVVILSAGLGVTYHRKCIHRIESKLGNFMELLL